jgi:hypothetical protein
MRAAILHLAFAGLGALEATSGAWQDNTRSLGISEAHGYEHNGVDLKLRRGQSELTGACAGIVDLVHLGRRRSCGKSTVLGLECVILGPILRGRVK